MSEPLISEKKDFICYRCKNTSWEKPCEIRNKIICNNCKKEYEELKEILEETANERIVHFLRGMPKEDAGKRQELK